MVGIDVDEDKVRALNAGKPTVYEKGVSSLLRRASSCGRFSGTTHFKELADAKLIFICVGTPSVEDGGIDLSVVESAIRSVGGVLGGKFPLVVMKSTVIPGTTANKVKPLLERRSGRKVGVNLGLCSNPEFLREGSAIRDTLFPDRVVVGAEDGRSGREMISFYKRFYAKHTPPIVLTDLGTAEMIKYAGNAFLAMKVSYINTIARICEKIPGSDIEVVAQAIGLDPRVGGRFLQAGPGYGGSCFPKDVSALISFARRKGVDTSLFEAVQDINTSQAVHVISSLGRLSGGLEGKIVAVLGLAFKAETDDIRSAPSIRIIDALLLRKARVRVYDPVAMENTRKVLRDRVTYSRSAKESLKGADVCLILTEWKEFSRLTPGVFSKLMRRPLIYDARRILESRKLGKSVQYHAIGLGS